MQPIHVKEGDVYNTPDVHTHAYSVMKCRRVSGVYLFLYFRTELPFTAAGTPISSTTAVQQTVAVNCCNVDCHFAGLVLHLLFLLVS